MLRDEPDWAERAEEFAARVRDVTEFLAEIEPRGARGTRCRCGSPTTTPATSPTRRACARSRASCCAAIPGSSWSSPTGWEICCGSAGIYNLTEPEPAAELGRRKVENLRATGAEAIAAANPGLRDPDRRARGGDRASRCPVYHPMELLALSIERRKADGAHRDRRRPRAADDRFDEVLTAEALGFVAELQREFEPRRQELLDAPRRAPGERDAGGKLDFLDETRDVREGDWRVAPAAGRPARTAASRSPARPTARWSSTRSTPARAGSWPTSRTRTRRRGPTWSTGSVNLRDAIDGTIEFDADGGQGVPAERGDRDAARAPARLAPARAPPDRSTASRSPARSCDFGLYFFHNAQALLDKGSGPYFYLPKMESHLEARLWNDVFELAEDAARHRPRHDPGDRPDRDDPRRRSRWRRSSTSCATTPRGSTPAAGTTSSR